MKRTTARCGLIVFTLSLLCLTSQVCAITAQDVFEEAVKRNLGESFRVVLTIHTFKGKKSISKHSLWLMGVTSKESSTFLLDFDEPEESKGLRFLITLTRGKGSTAYMYPPCHETDYPVGSGRPLGGLGRDRAHDGRHRRIPSQRGRSL